MFENLEELVKKCQKNDIRAQKKLYSLVGGKLFSVCLRYSSNREEAQDFLQDAFLRIFKYIHKYVKKDKITFYAWAKRVTVNVILRNLEKKNILKESSDIEDYEQEQKSENLGIPNLKHQDLMKLVNSLSPSKKVIFNLYVVEGYTHKEISEMLSISIGTSKSQLSRAKEIIKELIQKVEIHE